MTRDDSAQTPSTMRDWDAALLQHAQLDDLLNQFLAQAARTETASPGAELTSRIQRLARSVPLSGRGDADTVKPASAAAVGLMPDDMPVTAAGGAVPHRVGPYEILRPLGSGGMGDVYVARHTVLDRPVALKLLRPERAVLPRSRERFQREMRALAALQHVHVVSAYDGGLQGDVVYLAMELLDGVNLKQLLRIHPVLSTGVACEIIRQAALGLAALHQAGLVHRDVKPANIMLTRDGTVKLLDLGLVQRIDAERDLTGPLGVVGTERFMSPEQRQGLPDIDARADIYGLGRTLQQLLRWEVPPPVPEAGQVSKLPLPAAGLAELVRQMVAQHRDERLSSAAAVAECLVQYCGGADRLQLSALALGSSAGDQRHAAAELPAAKSGMSGGPFIPPVAWLACCGIGLTAAVSVAWMWHGSSDWTDPARMSAQPPADQGSGSETRDAGAVQSDWADPRVADAVVLAAREREFAEWVLQRGGSVTVNFQTAGQWVGSHIRTTAELPKSPFQIQVVDLTGIALDAPHRRQLRQLQAVEGLHLHGAGTSDVDLQGLNPAWPLKWLYVPGRAVTDQGVAALLAYRDSLIVLDLTHSRVTDASVRLLSTFSLLRGLMLAETQVTDAAIAHLADCPTLVLLDLSETQVTAAGIRRLADRPQLTKLKLRKLPVDDGLLSELSELPLVELDIRGTRVSAEAVRRLRESHPACVVQH